MATEGATTTPTAEGQGSTAPLRFSWSVEGVLSASGFPGSKENLQYLKENNVGCLVSLTAEKKVDSQGVDIKVVDIPVEDYNVPKFEQVDQFLDVVKETSLAGKGSCVHCAGGRGRTGVMLACYFVKEEGMQVSDAVDHIRTQRPGSIETAEQELFIYQYADYLRKKEVKAGKQ